VSEMSRADATEARVGQAMAGITASSDSDADT